MHDPTTLSPHAALLPPCDSFSRRHLGSEAAEALQGASLSKALDVDVSMALFSPRFERPMQDEQRLMRLDPDAPAFVEDLTRRGLLRRDEYKAASSADMERLYLKRG